MAGFSLGKRWEIVATAVVILSTMLPASLQAQSRDLDRWKQELVADIDARATFTQQMVDQI